MQARQPKNASKVPEVTLLFRVLKIVDTVITPTEGLGYGGGTVVFGVLLAVVAAGYFWTAISRTALFWAAFILTGPLGAVVGDLLARRTAVARRSHGVNSMAPWAR